MRFRRTMGPVALLALLAGGVCLAAKAGKPDLAAGKAVYDRDCAS